MSIRIAIRVKGNYPSVWLLNEHSHRMVKLLDVDDAIAYLEELNNTTMPKSAWHHYYEFIECQEPLIPIP